VSLAALRGQVVLVNFWATWCGPCRKEMPLLEQIHKKYAPLGFTMLGINVEEDTTHMEAFLGDVPVTFPVLLDPANQRQQAVRRGGHAEHGDHRPQGPGPLHPPGVAAG
jgi:thiol-disulfide isomerase/thioredoxin